MSVVLVRRNNGDDVSGDELGTQIVAYIASNDNSQDLGVVIHVLDVVLQASCPSAVGTAHCHPILTCHRQYAQLRKLPPPVIAQVLPFYHAVTLEGLIQTEPGRGKDWAMSTYLWP